MKIENKYPDIGKGEKLGMEQLVSKFLMCKSQLEGLLKHGLLGPTLRVSDLGLGGA